MSTTTTNYGMSKPDDIDLLGIQNGNMDIIDTQMKSNADNIAKKQDALTFDSTPTAGSKNPVTSEGIKAALDAKQATLTFDTTPTEKSTNPVTSGGIYSAMSLKANETDLTNHTGNSDIHVTAAQKTAWTAKQDALTFDTTPTAKSTNPVTSGGVYSAIALKADETDLTNHTGNSDIHVTAAQKASWTAKQDALTFDAIPTVNSTNPVTSGGVYTAMSGKQSTLTFDTVPTASSTNPCTSGGIKAALDNKAPAPITGTGAPTASTAGIVGQFYINTTDGSLYECTAVSGNTYIWKSSAIHDFKLLSSFTTAGTFTFTVPNGITEIIAFMIGGGGSGAAQTMYDGSYPYYAAASGGGSGLIEIVSESVSVGDTKSVVVGFGGNAVTTNTGNPGGSSTFDGRIAPGGKGGMGYSWSDSRVSAVGAGGGQHSDTMYQGVSSPAYTPFGGTSGGSDISALMSAKLATNSIMLKNNLFNIAAGGGAWLTRTDLNVWTGFAEASVVFQNGCSSSAGAAATNGAVSAVAGTDPGCGGGAAVCRSTYMPTSGAGHAGAVFVFGR